MATSIGSLLASKQISIEKPPGRVAAGGPDWVCGVREGCCRCDGALLSSAASIISIGGSDTGFVLLGSEFLTSMSIAWGSVLAFDEDDSGEEK